MDQTRRPRLSPAIADVRRAVRDALTSFQNSGLSPANAAKSGSNAENSPQSPEFWKGAESPLLLVALSGGPDSLALAAATAFEAPRLGWRAGVVIVDHGLQEGSADVAARAAKQARELGLDPVRISTVEVGTDGGPEAAAREARYAALDAAAEETGAQLVLLGHTMDDQAETVLLGLARGSGPNSLHGMAASTRSASGIYFERPLLGIRRSTTLQFCIDAGLEPWIDPQNADPQFARVRVRETVLPILERELGPGITEALARTADQLREDSDALDHFAEEIAEELADLAESGISLPVRALETNPAALRQRLIRLAVESEFHVSLSRAQTLEVARLVTHWHGQKALDLPGVRVERQGGRLVFMANTATANEPSE